MYTFRNISVFIYLLSVFTGYKVVLGACDGTGFPSNWTTATAGVTYWFVSETIKRQFAANYSMVDYTNGTVYGTPAECISEYYDSASGYYYYMMLYSGKNIYSTGNNIQVCQAFKQYDSVIREYYAVLTSKAQKDASFCPAHITSSTMSNALTKYNKIYVNCPFRNGDYSFTFTNDGNTDYCSGLTSTATISETTISLKSCFDPGHVNKSNPFYGAFKCLGSWSPESVMRDTPSDSNFLVVEMYNSTQWPYCGRYNASSNGVITLSLYLSMSESSSSFDSCDASRDHQYYFESSPTKYVRMIFTPVVTTTTTGSTTSAAAGGGSGTKVTTVTGSSTGTYETTTSFNLLDAIRDLYWPWWIVVATSIVAFTVLVICLTCAFLTLRKRCRKVETTKNDIDEIHNINLQNPSEQSWKQNRKNVELTKVKSLDSSIQSYPEKYWEPKMRNVEYSDDFYMQSYPHHIWKETTPPGVNMQSNPEIFWKQKIRDGKLIKVLAYHDKARDVFMD